MQSSVTIKYIYEVKNENKKIKTTEEAICYLGLNKLGDVWFCVDDIEKSCIKIRIALQEELKNLQDKENKNDSSYFLKTKKILKWEFPLKLKSFKLKIGGWIDFVDGTLEKTNSLYVKSINYNAK